MKANVAEKAGTSVVLTLKEIAKPEAKAGDKLQPGLKRQHGYHVAESPADLLAHNPTWKFAGQACRLLLARPI